jgi:hypothetical protein
VAALSTEDDDATAGLSLPSFPADSASLLEPFKAKQEPKSLLDSFKPKEEPKWYDPTRLLKPDDAKRCAILSRRMGRR